MALIPLTFEPIYSQTIWGGRALARLFGRQLPDGKVGESWEVADLDEGVSLCETPGFGGVSIRDLTARLGADLLGSAKPAPGGRFPLLLKYLDADAALSLQVHPDEQAARRIGGTAAMKTECWYVLESRDGAIYKGLAPGVTREEFSRAVRTEQAGGGAAALTGLLQRFDVKAGDFHYVPAGTVHALGAGVVVAEIQTPSNTTYRVSDWGRGRQLHVDEAMQSIHFTPAPVHSPGYDGTTLLATSYFTVARRMERPGEKELPAGRFEVWMVLSGRGLLLGGGRDDDQGVPLGPGKTVLLPAGMGPGFLTVEQTLTYLEITLPPARL